MQDPFYFETPVTTTQNIFFDSHSHIQYPLDEDILQTINRAKTIGLNYLISVGTNLATSIDALNLHAKYPKYIYPTAGLHPYESDKEFQPIKALFENHPELVAVGETGLDFYNCEIPKDIQLNSLRMHAKLAAKLDLPIILHLRPFEECFDLIWQILEQEQVKKAIFHCFSGSIDYAQKIWAKNFKTSFACNVTYPKNKELLEIMQQCPLQNLLIETDTPYLAPQGLRGQPNTPANLEYLKPILDNL